MMNLQTTNQFDLNSYSAEQIDELIKQLESANHDALFVEKDMIKSCKIQKLIGDCVDVYMMKKVIVL